MNTVFVDLVRQRVLTAAEHWLIQGFPHPDVEGLDENVRSRFPFASVVSMTSPTVMPSAHQRMLCGNTMHWSQIGLTFLYNLAFTRRRTLSA